MPPNPSELAASTTGTGERIVLVHGFTQSSRSFDRIARDLSSTYEVCAVDLPGHGGSADVAAPDLDSTARLVGETGGRATYLGYSLGGRVALTLAQARPDLVDRLVLVSATAGIADDAERAARRRSDETLATRLDPPSGAGLGLEEFLDEWLTQPLFAHLTPDQQDRPARRVNSPTGLASSLRTAGTGTQTPTHARLGELAMPVLVIVGARDDKFRAIGREMATAIGANAALAIVDDALHAPPFEQPESFLAVVREWLATHR